MAIYMKYGKIEGEATHVGHEKWIDINSLQFGVGRGIASPSGSVANREASQPSISEIVVTKVLDASSTKLFTESVTGSKGEEVQIHFVTTGNPGETYVEYTLSNALIAGYSLSSGGDRPSESISINFTKIQYKHVSSDGTNKQETPIVVSYDLATTKSG